jgi:tellurite resistance protein TerC
MLALDLGVFHRKARVVKTNEALLWCAFWFALALAFSFYVYSWKGSDTALEFVTGYLIEWSLSLDNIFVFLMIFSFFGVPPAYQHRVLFWGILGALIMRAFFIIAGVTLIQKFHWVIYVFGGFLLVTGMKMAFHQSREIHPERNPVLKVFRRVVPFTEGYDTGKFFVKRDGRYTATTLFVVLLLVETTDLIFAVDSIPAILAITTDPFIVYSSNVLAILGLRSLYFALAGVMRLFQYLHYGLAVILAFVGAKMLLSDFYKIPAVYALGIVAGILLASVICSVFRSRRLMPHGSVQDQASARGKTLDTEARIVHDEGAEVSK